MTWWERIIGWTNVTTSAASAKERLQLVLIHDRTDVTPATIELIKDEIIAVIQKHVAIDAGQVEVALTQDKRENRLVANIPLLEASARRRRR